MSKPLCTETPCIDFGKHYINYLPLYIRRHRRIEYIYHQ